MLTSFDEQHIITYLAIMLVPPWFPAAKFADNVKLTNDLIFVSNRNATNRARLMWAGNVAGFHVRNLPHA